MFNHETMIPFHGLTADFPSYANFFKENKNVYGSYWYHLGVNAKKPEKNLVNSED